MLSEKDQVKVGLASTQGLFLAHAPSLQPYGSTGTYAVPAETNRPNTNRRMRTDEHERAERWEQGRQTRLKEVNAELRRLARERREAIRQEHRRLTGRALPIPPSPLRV